MITKSQSDWAIKMLESTGKVGRNSALQRYITRLSAIIYDLKKSGWGIEGAFVKSKFGKDYVYTLIHKPSTK